MGKLRGAAFRVYYRVNENGNLYTVGYILISV